MRKTIFESYRVWTRPDCRKPSYAAERRFVARLSSVRVRVVQGHSGRISSLVLFADESAGSPSCDCSSSPICSGDCSDAGCCGHLRAAEAETIIKRTPCRLGRKPSASCAWMHWSAILMQSSRIYLMKGPTRTCSGFITESTTRCTRRAGAVCAPPGGAHRT